MLLLLTFPHFWGFIVEKLQSAVLQKLDSNGMYVRDTLNFV